MSFLKLSLAIVAVASLSITNSIAEKEVSQNPVVDRVMEIARVPADFRVGFCLLTEGDHQFVGYYDDQRRMTVAMRRLGEDKWTYKVLPSKVGWDSHNYVTMAVDRSGCLHVSGNIHADPLVYFRADKPWDVRSLRAAKMTGRSEKRTTYPNFLKDKEGRLIFNYRDGGSGNGRRIWNVYDEANKQWSRLLDSPLFEGKGEMNAYPTGPIRGPKGFYHMTWVWRDTPDCSTNHHLSYARSRDLRNWESADGEKVSLPITIDQKLLWIDPIPAGGGIINGGMRMVMATDGTPIVAYHKSDNNGHMQLYAARPDGEKWKRRRLTRWSKPVSFSGHGSMPFIGIRLGSLLQVKPGLLSLGYRHKDYGNGIVFFEERELDVVSRKIRMRSEWPKAMWRRQGTFPGLGVRRASDLGSSGEKGVHYALQWESLGSNRDKRPEPPLPEPSMLRLYRIRTPE